MREIIDRKVVLSSLWSTARQTLAFFARADLLLVIAITLAPAQILGLDALVGSIEPGKIANLVVSRGDPLDIRSEITHVFVKGVPVSLQTRHTELYEKYKARPKPGEPARPLTTSLPSR